MTSERTFFVTTICAGRNPIFGHEAAARLFLDPFFEYRAAQKYKIHAFVVMPDHLHAIITPSEVLSLEKAMQLIKGGSSHRLGKQLLPKTEIWQRSFTQHRIRDAEDFAKHSAYIDQNPVRAGFVKMAEEYPYSSASGTFEIDPWDF